jgi:hypothetical protein
MGRFPLDLEVITCGQWGARRPKQGIQTVGESVRTIFHHTAGHHRELGNPKNQSREESMQYARDIQKYHMDGNGWNDSGHNFLICRNGLVLQGRWLTVSAIQASHMVGSAHCPGQNGQIGLEHEHYGSEEMTREQKEASSMLMAWIAWHYERKNVLPSMPHSKYFPTSCPANLNEDIAGIVKRAQVLLNNAYAV